MGARYLAQQRRGGKFLGKQYRDDNTNTSWYLAYDSALMANKSTYYLPFIPQSYNLDQDTIALNATHPLSGYTQEFTHSLMGHMQTKRTHGLLKASFNDTDLNDTRPFIMSRSTFAGSGQYAQHWIGEQKRDFMSLRQSIAGVMNFNMFGIPFTGADVCGKYGGDVAADEDEVCARWY
jgi:alpha-glucosidase (family GH31 glycosyl hydrolase)